ncbi:MAG: class I SAM-dependent methyltransferase [Candidatus Omnitrophica bacterium]|nr:class I SAM-dependent methyltransferase [Candidatus Omnitrophota bacterium]
MKFRLLDVVVCPKCNGQFDVNAKTLTEGDIKDISMPDNRCSDRCAYHEFLNKSIPFKSCAECYTKEIKKGTLSCKTCGEVYQIEDNIPRLVNTKLSSKTEATKESFGYLWMRGPGIPRKPRSDSGSKYHFDKVAHFAEPLPKNGLWLDAGCGNGSDVRVMSKYDARRKEIVGLDISEGGIREAYVKNAHNPFVHIVQGDIIRIPFKKHIFDFAYSYGVLHHIENPTSGIREINRVLKKEKEALIYLYEDFSDRNFIERLLLKAVNTMRRFTTQLPHHALYAGCLALSPIVYIFLTLPARLLGNFRKTASLATRIPYHHSKGFFNVVMDIYDRFSAPIEIRYSRTDAFELLNKNGFKNVGIAKKRGWVVWGTKAENV